MVAVTVRRMKARTGMHHERGREKRELMRKRSGCVVTGAKRAKSVPDEDRHRLLSMAERA